MVGWWWEPGLLYGYFPAWHQGTLGANKGRREGQGGRQAHLFHLLRGVQHGPDDHHSVQKIERDAVRRGDVLCAPVRARMITSPWAL